VTEEIRIEPVDRRRRREAERRRRRRAAVRLGVAAGLLLVAFLAGLAVGKAVEDAPQPGGTQTLVRTLTPVTVGPKVRTVTVTTP
jgi:hypothetical protein